MAGVGSSKTYRTGAPLGMLAKGMRPLNGSSSSSSSSALSSTSGSAAPAAAAATSTPMHRGETLSVANNINRVLHGYTNTIVKALETYYHCRLGEGSLSLSLETL